MDENYSAWIIKRARNFLGNGEKIARGENAQRRKLQRRRCEKYIRREGKLLPKVL